MAEIDFLGALGAGSDIDSKSLVQSLVDAERAPRESSLNTKIEDTNSKISAYGEVLSSLGVLSDAFAGLNDASDFADYTVNVNGALALDGSPAYSVAATSDIAAGINEIAVTSIATKDRWVSENGYAAITTAINGGNPFTLTVTTGGTPTSVTVSDPTPDGVVEALNAAGLGITASLVNTGDANSPYKILVEGQLGENNGFELASDASVGNTLTLTALVPRASNAELTINGVAIERPANVIDDALTGATLTLSAPTAATSQISVERDTTGVESRVRALVDAYNSANAVFRSLMSVDGTGENAGALSGNSGFRLVVDRVSALFTNPSSTATDELTYLNDIGIQFNQSGELEIDDARLADALTTNFDDVVTLLSADTDNQTIYGAADRGLAGDAVQTLTELMATDGAIMTQSSNMSSRIVEYQDQLDDLDRRMTQIYDRYLAQFTAMETAIDQLNSTRDYLKSALDGLPFNNRNSN